MIKPKGYITQQVSFWIPVEEAINEPTLRVDADEVVICSLKSYYSDFECKRDGEKIVFVCFCLSLIHEHFYSVLSSPSRVQSNVSMSSHQADVVLSYLSTCAREPKLYSLLLLSRTRSRSRLRSVWNIITKHSKICVLPKIHTKYFR